MVWRDVKEGIAIKGDERLNYLLFVIICFIGGTTWAVQKIGLTNSIPLWSAACRFVIAGLILLVIQLIRRAMLFDKQTIKMALLYGSFYFAIPFGVVYYVSKYLPSGLVSVLGTTIALFTLIFNSFLKGRSTFFVQKIGSCLALTGIVVVFFNKMILTFEWRIFLCIIALLIAFGGTALIMVVVKKNIENVDRLSFNSLSLIIGGVILSLISILFEKGNRFFVGESFGALLYLAVIGSVVGVSINTHLIHKWHIAKMSSSLYISPIVALFIGYIFLNEKLEFSVYIGSFLVIIGVYLINVDNKQKGLIK